MSGHLTDRELNRFDELDPRTRSELLGHVRDCSACRARWTAGEPSRLFALLALAPVDDTALEGLSAAVERAIGTATRRRKRGRIYAAASIAASLLLAAVVGGILWNDDVDSPEAPTTAVEAGLQDTENWSGVELVDSPGDARVVGLTIGETRVMMIFDEALDL